MRPYITLRGLLLRGSPKHRTATSLPTIFASRVLRRSASGASPNAVGSIRRYDTAAMRPSSLRQENPNVQCCDRRNMSLLVMPMTRAVTSRQTAGYRFRIAETSPSAITCERSRSYVARSNGIGDSCSVSTPNRWRASARGEPVEHLAIGVADRDEIEVICRPRRVPALHERRRLLEIVRTVP